ncbi:NAD(P)H-quinone oxidoreductase [Rhodoferax sp. U2-2l]|uniref:NAD(P)H-quinone oxidoreductase n=1 Tax=Rhodoferax sp. U2-2l TaxID=2884000 RepID=UPI001D09ADFA|nr:NAD(P)H-quinone oxidoreductase [Rhodoferax sp. U2-2l]MCB8746633.1 NAD(P)H-quinone oxidoreductase [Rhodoferax sp. U2-2l]
MKTIEITGYGASDVLRLGERPMPVAGAGELLIRVTASGVNRPDVLQRQGNYPVPPGASDILGLEVAGSIAQGDAAELAAAGFQLGDRVCALVAGGGYAEYCVAPIGQCLPVPDGLTDIEAASLPETFFTVWSNLMARARLQPGESVLIQGGGSGIGVTAIQLARLTGARVFVTAGSDDKCAACVALGAQAAINYKTQDFKDEIMRLTDGQGVDVILDIVAGSYVAKEVQCLKEDGRLVIISIQGGTRSEFNAGLVLRKRLTITGSTLRPRPVAFKAAIAKACLENVWPALADGRIKPVVYRTFAAADVVQAHELMESSQHIGKIVLIWSES